MSEKTKHQNMINLQVDTSNELKELRVELSTPIHGLPSYTKVIQFLLDSYKNKNRS